MLREKTLFEYRDKVKESTEFLKDLEPPEGYYLAFSGGKDSITIYRLAQLAGVKFDAHYSVTTIDPPELVYFIRDHYPDVKWERPKMSFLHRLVDKGFPTRQMRWCCEEYKETGGSGRVVITGVRKAESNKRSGRRAVEFCYRDKTKRFVNPIINWSDREVWQFIREQKLEYCKLYDEGHKRLGCLFCPMAYNRAKDAKRYPGYVRVFIQAFERFYANRKAQGKTSVDRWKNGEEMFWWWLMERRKPEDPDQGVMFE
jgi:phosphoadenosine phosphosulfate reductase